MVYSELVKKAAQISFNAHKDDVDKAGYPYFMHPLTVAFSMDDEYSVIVALLHDVVEDHGDVYNFEVLAKEFPSEVIEALKLLTHEPGVDYLDYVRKIKDNPIARKVKIADLKHNSDLHRTGSKPPKYETYLKALEILNS